MGRGWASIRTKLIAFIAIPIAAIVVIFAWYFTSQQMREDTAYAETDVRVYGEQFAAELRTAVASGDRSTASEVLAPIAVDDDVVATTLFGSENEVLYQRGTPSTWIERARKGVVTLQVVHTAERTSVVVPVVSLEGPRGTFVLEISSARRLAQAHRLVRNSILVGLGSLAFGVFVAWLIARSLASRLAAMAKVATIATSDLRVTVDDRGNDEIGMLAIAFNQMLGQLRADRARLQLTVIDLRTTEDELAMTNLELEQRVALRTVQLEDEMRRRSAMELELRQAQKLESVGRLAAGIAHEINSPVQFVSHSCSFLDEATQALVDVSRHRRVDVAAAEAGTITLAQLVERLRAADIAADIDDLIDSMPAANKLVLQGLDRVTSIVRAMKEFAYADQPTQTPADLNRAIQNTLVVTCNEYKYLADIKVELGSLPLVTCHLGEFNQAVLNIVVNAAHAIQDRIEGTDRRGCITIETRTEGPDVVVSITDDGCGIPPHIIEKIYDPFFTTKTIGRGSGQGLAIARSVIVDKHHGRLDVESTLGQGTTFTIRLPIEGASPQGRALAA
ncbi:hypothetical protein BH11MYX1_BH11MYX1_53290 [soil metagenome]